MGRLFLLSIFAAGFFLFSPNGNARETNAEISTAAPPPVRWDDIYLLLMGRAAEGSQGGLSTPDWKLGASTKWDSRFSAELTIGASSLLFRPRWYSSSTRNLVDLLEAKGTYQTSILDVYGGEFLLPWGLEGQTTEQDLEFPRSLLYEQGLFPLRDSGVGVKASAEGFYFDLSAHSGAGSVSNSNRIFVTGQWGYRTPHQSGLAISATSGRYMSTASAVTETVLRGGNIFLKFNVMQLLAQLEGSYFQNVTGTAETAELAWHGDLKWPISDHVTLLGRYEQYNPNTRVNLNIIGRGYLGAEWFISNRTSRVLFYLIKNNESQQEYPNDEVRVSWSWGY